ncbi:MAG: glycosyltransferase [Steroidobacteraceae bacterium]
MNTELAVVSSESSLARPGLLYIVNSLNPGGTERLVMEMGLAFSDEFRVAIVCLDEPGRWATDLRRRGIPVHCLWRQPGLDLSMPVKIARIARESDAALIHAHQCTPWFYGALSRMFYSAPRLLLEEHGRFYPEEEKPARRRVNRAVIVPLSHRFVAVSEDVRWRLDRYEGLDAARVDVIYNGVDVGAPLSALQRGALRQSLGFADSDIVVGTVGRFDPIKNLPMLIEGLASAREQNSRIRGLLVGDGPQFGAVQQLLEAHGLKEAVCLTGFRSDARQLVQCMDLFVLSSFSEGTSMALLEAMASGVAAVVTAVGGNPEIVVAGETGWVVPSGAVSALTSAVLDAAADESLRRDLGRAGRQRFEDHFTFARMLESYRALYRSMMPAAVREPA